MRVWMALYFPALTVCCALPLHAPEGTTLEGYDGLVHSVAHYRCCKNRHGPAPRRGDAAILREPRSCDGTQFAQLRLPQAPLLRSRGSA